MFTVAVLPNGIRPKASPANPNNHTLCVSLCLNINNAFTGFDPEDSKRKENLELFAKKFLTLREGLAKQKISVSTDNKTYDEVGTTSHANPFWAYSDEHGPNDTKFLGLAASEFWKALFSAGVNPASSMTPRSAKIDPLFDHGPSELSGLPMTNFFLENLLNPMATEIESRKQRDYGTNGLAKATLLAQLNEAALKRPRDEYYRVMQKLRNVHDTAKSRVAGATTEMLRFIANHASVKLDEVFAEFESSRFAPSKTNNLKAILKAEKIALDNYYSSGEVDIDDVATTFSAVSNHPFLMRLLGFIVDLEIELPKQFIPSGDYRADDLKTVTAFYLTTVTKDSLVEDFATPVVGMKLGRKYGYLVNSDKDPYFKNSILQEEHSYLLRHDPLANEQHMMRLLERSVQKREFNPKEAPNSFTRGILYTNNELPKILQPVTPPPTIDGKKPVLSEEHVSHGYRVGMSIQNARKDEAKYFSLTSRQVTLEYDSGKGGRSKLLHCDSMESCIHIDAPMAVLDVDKTAEAHVVSNTVFQYSGELLLLKSAFSTASSKRTLLQAFADSQETSADLSLKKSEHRVSKLVSFFYFPFNEVLERKRFNVRYNIPAEYKKHGPKLRLGNTYGFIVSREYLNGYGLPLQTTNPDPQGCQSLTLVDLVQLQEGRKVLKFDLLENKKPLLLFHTRPVNEAAESSLTDKESLTELVLRSDNGSDCFVRDVARHILPERISLEHAFWHDLLSPSKVSPRKSFEWRNKYNCPYHNRAEFNSRPKDEQCPQHCSVYCGGTGMAQYYPQSFITPNYIPDPEIKGVQVQLFWDRECTLFATGSADAYFERPSPLLVTSCRLKVDACDNKTPVKRWLFGGKDRLVVRLKKGLQLYALLSNLPNDPRVKSTSQGFWWDSFQSSFRNKKFDFQNIATAFNSECRPQLVLSLTHAVKEPLITPTIHALESQPDNPQKVAHLKNWLAGKYAGFKLGENIIAGRELPTPDTFTEAESARVVLQAHFERLDIRSLDFIKNNTDFLNGLPTGGLELWMRKEEFNDDPTQLTASEPGESRKSPDQPVLSFCDPRNLFRKEHLIEFTDDTMAQFKDPVKVRQLPDQSDPFQAFVSTLDLRIKVNSRKFEIREYYLKDISKFHGYFPKDPKVDATNSESAEEFALPKLADVQKKEKLRFKVMLLNNQRLQTPRVICALTTIRETREYKAYKTISTQRGNSVTFYFHCDGFNPGRDDRVGMILKECCYYDTFVKAGMVSQAGRDLVTDQFSAPDQLLSQQHIIVREPNEYQAAFDDDLGIFHFLPTFDPERRCWKFEVELNLTTSDRTQMHNPFVNFALVHFQPFSINHNLKGKDSTLKDIYNDLRLSEVTTSVWGQLTPDRSLSIVFHKPQFLFGSPGMVKLTVSFDHSSLSLMKQPDQSWKLRSDFVVSVEGSNDRIIWKPVPSATMSAPQVPRYSHFMLAPAYRNSGSNDRREMDLELLFDKRFAPENSVYPHYRLRFLEVETFGDGTELDCKPDEDVLHREDLRVRYIDLVD